MLINGEEHNELCVGIDLGTTNSVLATVNIKPNGDAVSKVIDIPRAVDRYSIGNGTKFQMKKSPTLPSCVYYNEEDRYKAIVGDFAKARYSLRPHLVAKSIKSQMGKKEADGLSPEIPDKTPSEISARILSHMLRSAEKICRTKIDDAIITVPANFDSLMCQATRDAAEIAGIKVRNADETERPILLSEPNAVIYDFINQVKNGEISNTILDLNSPKYVLVFDLGGGTLDITLHEIAKRVDHQDVLKVDEIATNRYTLLGGDDFDKKIAETMFERYLNSYRNHPDVITKLKHEEKTVMPQMLAYAESLKIDLSMSKSEEFASSGWDDDDEEDMFNVGGNISSTGYAYDDSFTTAEIEEILQPFMGNGLVFNDYMRLNEVMKTHGTKNIILPILDVLDKAAKKLGKDELRIDAVLMNGGMSRFYMVVNRLKSFFGIDPIVALDPDQAVARGAAIYHYYLHRYEALKDDMKMIGIQSAVQRNADARDRLSEKAFPLRNALNSQDEKEVLKKKPVTMASMAHTDSLHSSADVYAKIGIQWGNTILNDSLYLGMKNDSQVEIIPTGTSLPYTSELMKGFFLSPGTNRIAVPIKSRNLDGSFRTIARGNILFEGQYPDGAYVAFSILMNTNKVITMQAWTCQDREANHILDSGRTEISISDDMNLKKKNKILPQSGTRLNPIAELYSLEQLCRKFQNSPQKKRELSPYWPRIYAYWYLAFVQQEIQRILPSQSLIV